MGGRSKLRKALLLAEEILVAFDGYFRRPQWYTKDFFPSRNYRNFSTYLEKLLEEKDKEENWLKLFATIFKPWDGYWRLVVFDVPEKQRMFRDALRRRLVDFGFAQLQRSVWLSFLPVDTLWRDLAREIEDSGRYSLFRGKLVEGEPVTGLVRRLWPVDQWLTEANQLLKKLERMGKITRQEKQQFWQLVLSHPRVPLNLLPQNRILARMVRRFVKSVVLGR